MSLQQERGIPHINLLIRHKLSYPIQNGPDEWCVGLLMLQAAIRFEQRPRRRRDSIKDGYCGYSVLGIGYWSSVPCGYWVFGQAA